MWKVCGRGRKFRPKKQGGGMPGLGAVFYPPHYTLYIANDASRSPKV